MTEDVAYVKLPGMRDDVLEVLRTRQVSGVPVVKGDEVVGIVTRRDLLKNPEEEQIVFLMQRDPVMISPDASIVEAARLLVKHGIRRLPVVVGKKLVGIITVADIIREIAKLGIEKPIEKYVRRELLALWDETPLPVAGRIMELADVRAAPVLDAELKLVGIVTDQDLINAAVVEHSTESADMSLAHDEDEWTWEGMRGTMRIYYSVSKIKLPNKLIKEVMVKDVVTATKSSTVSDCAHKMSANDFNQLPVVSSRMKLIGILLDRDLLKVLT
ncbi:MAG: CBS domain-containing protein [Candidatus Alkanophagales archaeon]|nr:MAG: CBS domain-containing protein [Candidatus Alkanophagales archaeon]